jgi:hypothetical protein
MDFTNIFEGIILIILGTTLVIFHKKLGDFATRFREKVNEVKHDESTQEFGRAFSLIMGIGLIIYGIIVLF